MQTVSLGMAEFCGQADLDTEHVQRVGFFFAGVDGLDQYAQLDSIELSHNPYDEAGQCGLMSAMYACVATETLEATRTSCDGEPISGECPSPNVVTDPVSIPWVSGVGAGFLGWLIHAPTGPVMDVEDPTTVELEYLAARCVEACEDEWADDPFVDASCDAPGAFESPAFVASPSVGTRRAIPSAQTNGSDLFMGQSLGCSLLDSCCQDFDEQDVCPAGPTRVTPARVPLGEGQEWELTVAGSTWADSDYAVEEVGASMVGTIGYSFCTEGDGVNCPFYVGSLHLELAETLTLELECNGMTEEHEITELEFDLVQPVMGISEVGSSFKAFPPRAIVIEATGEADGLPVYVRGPIELPIYYEAGEGWTLLQGSGGAYIHLDVPCNGEIADVKLWWGFEEDTVTASPPQVAVSLPSTVACPDELELLLATGSDPDDDVASLEWVVDGVLLSETWPTIDFTEGHEITAILRDARGAAASDTQTVTCQ